MRKSAKLAQDASETSVVGQHPTDTVKVAHIENATLKTVTRVDLTHAELAEKLGVNRQVITWHSKKPEAPPIGDVEAWRAYLDDKLASIDGEMTKKLSAQRLRKWTAEADMAERENQLKAGQVIQLSDVKRYALEINSFFFGEWERIRQTWPSLLKGRPELEIFKVIDAEVPKIKAGLVSRLEGLIGK